MKVVSLTLGIWFVASLASAQSLVAEFSWAEREKSGQLQTGESVKIAQDQNGELLQIVHSESKPISITVLKIEKPNIQALAYAVEGKVRCKDVQGESYLEMWSTYSDGNKYFSRNLVDAELLKPLTGSCDWRPFALPFFRTDNSGPPTLLEVNIVLAGTGTVELSPLKLIQYAPDELQKHLEISLNLPDAGNAWWSEKTSKWAQIIIGLIWGLTILMAMRLSGQGKARRVVLGVYIAFCAFGVLTTILGFIAQGLGQPYVVYGGLILGSVIALVNGLGIPQLRRRYEQAELRKMAAKDCKE